jgi:hypothetical protein
VEDSKVIGAVSKLQYMKERENTVSTLKKSIITVEIFTVQSATGDGLQKKLEK